MEEQIQKISDAGTVKSKEEKEKIDLKMLIAEDTPEIKEFLEIILAGRYSSVESVENGKLLLEKLSNSEYKIDFIITDNTMPEMTGIAAIRKIREINRLKDIPIILYTTDEDGSLKSEAEALGAVFLKKPVTKMEDLYNLIDSLRRRGDSTIENLSQ